MKLLTKNTDYAVRALVGLAMSREGYVSARQMSREQSIPYQYLRRILQELIRNGLAESKEGANGGVKLTAEPGKISIVDVINIFQGQIELSDCMFRKNICANRQSCVLRKEIKNIENIVTQEFGKLTIQTLVD